MHDITIVAVYCPMKHKISTQQYTDFFKSGGDYNTKHYLWVQNSLTTRKSLGKSNKKIILRYNGDWRTYVHTGYQHKKKHSIC